MGIKKITPFNITKTYIDNNSEDSNYKSLLRKHKIINILYNEQQSEIKNIKNRLDELERRNK